MSSHLTQALVDKIKPSARAKVVRDGQVSGFFVRASKTKVVYKVQVQRHGVTRAKTLGRTSTMSLKEARDEAQRFILEASEHPYWRAVAPKEANLAETLEEYLASKTKLRPSSVKAIKKHATYIPTYLQRKALAAITPDECSKLHREITEANGPVIAKSVMATIRAVCNWKQKRLRGALPGNPITVISDEFVPYKQREVAMTPLELAHWWRELETLFNPVRRAMHSIGVCTGLRPGNLMSLHRDWYRDGNLVLPASEMKAGVEFVLPLCEQAQAMLPDGNSEWFFPRRRGNGPTTNHREKNNAFLMGEDTGHLRTGHVLRHTFASVAASCHVPELHIRMLMAHASMQGTTAGYIRGASLLEDLRASHAIIVEKITAQRPSRTARLTVKRPAS